MKQILFFATFFFVAVVFSLKAQQVVLAPSAEHSFNEGMRGMVDLQGQLRISARSTLERRGVSLNEARDIVQKKLGSRLLVTSNEGKDWEYQSLDLKAGVEREVDREAWKRKGISYLKDLFAGVLGKDEELKILTLGTDTRQEVVNVQKYPGKSPGKTRTYTVELVVGRLFLNKPVLDSLVRLEYDPASDQMIGFSASSFQPVTSVTVAGVDLLGSSELRTRVQGYYNNWNLGANGPTVEGVIVEEVVVGWAIDGAGRLTPAFSHLDTIRKSGDSPNVAPTKNYSMELIGS